MSDQWHSLTRQWLRVPIVPKELCTSGWLWKNRAETFAIRFLSLNHFNPHCPRSKIQHGTASLIHDYIFRLCWGCMPLHSKQTNLASRSSATVPNSSILNQSDCILGLLVQLSTMKGGRSCVNRRASVKSFLFRQILAFCCGSVHLVLWHRLPVWTDKTIHVSSRWLLQITQNKRKKVPKAGEVRVK